jgi:hypothetical protein
MFYKPTTPSTKWVFGCRLVFNDRPLYPKKNAYLVVINKHKHFTTSTTSKHKHFTTSTTSICEKNLCNETTNKANISSIATIRAKLCLPIPNLTIVTTKVQTQVSPNSFSRPAANTLNLNTTKEKNLADHNPKPNF